MLHISDHCLLRQQNLRSWACVRRTTSANIPETHLPRTIKSKKQNCSTVAALLESAILSGANHTKLLKIVFQSQRKGIRSWMVNKKKILCPFALLPACPKREVGCKGAGAVFCKLPFQGQFALARGSILLQTLNFTSNCQCEARSRQSL